MRFTVSQSALAKALSIASHAISSSATQPVLSCIYLKAAEGTIELESTNLTTYIRTKIPANIEQEGNAVVSGKILSNIVKVLPDAAIRFDGDEKGLTISCLKSNYSLNVLNPGDYREFLFPDYALERSIELPKELVSSMVDKVYKATSKDSSRPIFHGIFMTLEENVLRMVASDSHRVAVCDTNIETSSVEKSFKVIIPGDAFHEVLSLPSDESDILIGFTSNQVVFSTGTTTYLSRRLEGDFINYKGLLPSETVSSVKLDLGEFAAALKRVAVIATAGAIAKKPPLISFVIDAEGNTLTLTSMATDQGEAREIVPAEVTGGDVSIAFNYQYVADCIGAIEGEKEILFEVGLVRNKNVGSFKSFAKVNYLYLMMPLFSRNQ